MSTIFSFYLLVNGFSIDADLLTVFPAVPCFKPVLCHSYPLKNLDFTRVQPRNDSNIGSHIFQIFFHSVLLFCIAELLLSCSHKGNWLQIL